MICLILWDKCRLKSGGLLSKLEAWAASWFYEWMKFFSKNMQQQWSLQPSTVIMGLDLRAKKILYNTKVSEAGQAWLNLCEIFECVWVALKFAVDQICPSWIPARFSGHSCSEAAAPIILLLTLSHSKVSSSNCEQQQQLLFCAHDDPLFQGLELSTLFLLNICC